MSSAVQDFLIPLLGALQAAIAVLLTISIGVVASQLGWLSNPSSKEISKICVNIFLPALLIYNIGSNIAIDNAVRVVPIIIWAILYNAVSVAWGFVATKCFNLPDWVTPAIAFNNTTALPLLLIQSLDSTGILTKIDDTDDAISRAKFYLLMNAMIGNSLTFAVGPKLLNGQNEDAPDQEEKDPSDEDIDEEAQSDLEETREANEQTSLLPPGVANGAARADMERAKRAKKLWTRLPLWTRPFVDFLQQFWNPPLIGALIGIIIGVTPPLHSAFFNQMNDGGYLNAWLTSAIKNAGDLFASLQILVVGVKLASSLVAAKQGKAPPGLPWLPVTIILVTRFVLWPVISIATIYLIVVKTGLLSNDPLLWFCMMLMPTGPPALKLTALADVNGASEDEKMTISKFLVLAYSISPVIAFTVVGGLKATQAAMQ